MTPSLTHGLGAVDILALAFCAARDDDATVSAYPSGYSYLTVEQQSGGGGNNSAELGIAALQTTAASVDPGTFTLSESENWVAQTVVLGPAAAATVIEDPPQIKASISNPIGLIGYIHGVHSVLESICVVNYITNTPCRCSDHNRFLTTINY